MNNGDIMDNEKLMDQLAKSIDKTKAGNLHSYKDKVELWKREFDNRSALKWSDKTIDYENQYLKSCLTKKKLLNCYDIKSLAPVEEKYNNKLIIWDDNISSMVVDAIVVPASYDITDVKERKLHDIYYCNGIRIRKKILTIMDGEKLNKNEVLITRSYNVLADYIIHVNYENIRESIINVMECARVNMIKALVICLDNSLDEVREIYDIIIEYLSKFDIMFDKVILSIEQEDVRNSFIEELEKEA